MVSVNQDNRVYGVDLLKVMAMAVIFLSHSANQFSCNYYFLSPLAGLRSPAMTLFFMLSGYILYINYMRSNLLEVVEIKRFLIRRAISILPVYYLIVFIFVVAVDSQDIMESLKLIPIEVLGLQTTVESLFAISHNGGTWFISCLMISYFIFPYIQEIIKQSSYRRTLIIICLLILFLTYANFLVGWFDLATIYSNPFYRGLEFILGIAIAKISIDMKLNDLNKQQRKQNIICFFIVLCILIILAYKKDFLIYEHSIIEFLYYILIPLLLLFGGGIKGNQKPLNFRIVKAMLRYLSDIALEFFLVQFFVWQISGWIISIFAINSNLYRILISFTVCLLLASATHYLFSRPISRFLRKRLKVS